MPDVQLSSYLCYQELIRQRFYNIKATIKTPQGLCQMDTH